jgi:hypothetical protein
VHRFYPGAMGCISVGNMREPIRNLTNPQTVKITCSYLWEFNLNRSWTTRNIFTERMRCSTNTLFAENFWFSCFCSIVNSRFFGFLIGVEMTSSPL